MREVNLEPITQSEVSQKEKQKQWWYTNAYRQTLERWYWWAYLQSSRGDTDIENRLTDTAGEGRRRGWEVGESNRETYITICKIDSQWEFALWLRELTSRLDNNLEGWDGEEEWGMFKWEPTWVNLWLIHIDAWLKPMHYCRAIILQLKIH